MYVPEKPPNPASFWHEAPDREHGYKPRSRHCVARGQAAIRFAADRNGFSFSVEETDERTALIETKFSLADSEAIHQEGCRIVVERRSQVREARLVTSTQVHGIGNLLTLNVKDFRRFSGIAVLSPEEVFASAG